MTRTRPARPADADALCDIINPIIHAGGTTAHATPFDPARMLRHYLAPPRLIACTVAEHDGVIAGFQSLVWPDEEGDIFPEGWAIIGSFVRQDMGGRGIGRALFDATRAAASAAGVHTIDATIRADNDGGLAFYEALGFTDYDILRAVPLRDGRPVDRIRRKLEI